MHLKLPSVPAYSFPKTGRDRWGNELAPGPGQYEGKYNELSTHKNGVRTTMNRAGIQPLNKNDGSPGPGNYESSISTLSKRGQYIIGTSKRDFNLGREGLPGPGQYETDYSSLNKRGYAVIKTGREPNKGDRIPGPGDYETNKSSFSRRGVAPVKSVGNMRKEYTPGPLDYDPYSYEEKSRLKSGMKMTEAPRSVNNINNNPGPADYADNYSSLSRKGFAAVNTKRSIFDKTDTPGPGNYETTISSLTKKGVAKLGPPTQVHTDFSTPGPGTYESSQNQKSSIKGSTIPHAGRDYNPNKDNSPGPAVYDSHVSLDYVKNKKGLGAALPKASNSSRPDGNPGPGQYETNISGLSKVGQAALPRAPRDTNNKNNNPGPADYENGKLFEINGNKKGITIPHANKGMRKDETPGPGHYEYKSTVPNVAPYLLTKQGA